MKPSRIIEDTLTESELRADRRKRIEALVRQVTPEPEHRWRDARDMLGWYFANYDRMHSPPAIDPSREVIQGLRVDRDQRIHDVAYVSVALRELAKKQGHDRGVLLLWMNFRSPSQTGHVRDPDGRKRVQYGLPGIAIRDLYREAGGSREKTTAEYWEALTLVEDFAVQRRWVAARIERKTKVAEVRVYRRRG